ncbi:restriction endonuclease subunit S [uncultured Sulfitobacter sp.]|uniref:restriction endonuclease subunit S n=1 Tax=uncultured Sulfitobacter sp. TaxID=191468 RepID=UPI00259351FC|nr:restriction endonuclease subunit S [uncultured Sulfitobacter sp.]
MREGWRKVAISELATFHSGGTPNKAQASYWGGSIPWVTVKDMKVMRLNGVGENLTDEGAATVRTVPAGSVLVLVRGMGLFKDLPVVLCDRPVTFNQDIKALVTKQGIDSEYFAFALIARKSDILRHVDSAGHGTGRLDTDLLKSTPIPLPPPPEQRKIAEILRAWDEALEKLTALRAAKERRLGALRYAMLFGELHLDDQRRNWLPTRLAAVTHELTTRNGAKGLGRDYVMGVTKAQGVIPMREQTIAGDISRYKRLPPRAFAYNPMRINVGSIAKNERDEEVLVSPDYVVFACNADGLDPDYLDHLRKTSWWAHYINSGGSGSVRQRTYYDDLAALKLPLPELDEQKVIAAVLNTARDDLAATEREIEAVTRQKRGLMQKLLTGEWRVEGEDS